MNFSEAKKKLESLGQEWLIPLLDCPNARLLDQIEKIDPQLLRLQQHAIKSPCPSSFSYTPYETYSLSGKEADFNLGKSLISQGLMGCLIVAGGQGTRLGFSHPKGMYPVSAVRNKTLFQLAAEKIAAASRQAGRPLPAAIMTSQQNHQETLSFFQQHHYFGLSPEQISFYSQETLPFLDQEGNLILTTEQLIAEGPDGNGFALHHFWKKGIGAQWEKQGVRYLNFVLIDNPLADPFDAELLGCHVSRKMEATLKCTLKRGPEEKVGVLIQREGHLGVAEYGEIEDPLFKCRCANLSLLCLSMDFTKKIALENPADLPLHASWKEIPNDGKKGWKFERFIFDILSQTIHSHAILFPREDCFAPLKNKNGADSPETVRKALIERDRRKIEEISSRPFKGDTLELAADFYYPTPALLKKWKDQPLPQEGYFES